jgi:hypothetical protein
MGRQRLWTTMLIAALLSGCGNSEENPVGSGLVTRGHGRVVELPLLPSRGGSTRFEGTFSRGFGEDEQLMVGRMGGLVFRSLMRVRLDPDSLVSAAAGATGETLDVRSVQMWIWKREPARGLEELQVHRPEQAWNEADEFVDTLRHTAVNFASSAIDGATASALGDSLIQIDLPPGYLSSAVRENPDSPTVDVLLQPAAGTRFFASLVSRDDSLPENINRQPVLRLTYSVDGNTYTHVADVSEDTYWAARDGPEPGMLVLATTVRLSPVFRFDLPDTIPMGTTVTSSELWLNYDRSQSMFGEFTFSVERININSATEDTTFSLVNTWGFDGQVASYALDQTLVQGWISGTRPNLGLALSTPIADLQNWEVNWVVFHNPMLKLVYSTPPDP